MTNSRFYSSTAAVTSLQVTANSGDASIQVASSTGWPGSFPYTVSLDYGSANEELVDVTGGGPNIFTVTRAVDGTSATTHNAGAVVRHVSSARDFTDSRTHESSSTGVHGITGSFVDTASTQTLSNKTLNSPILNNPTVAGTATATGATISNGTYAGSTLTNPTINSATLSGTIAGSPTFSGSPTVSGTTTLNGTVVANASIDSTRLAATNSALTAKVTGDSVVRFNVRADGQLEWGSGSGARDTTLARSGSGFLTLSNSLTANGSVTATGNLLGAEVSTTATTWTPFTPSWTINGSPATTTNVGWYWKLGKIVFFEIYTNWSAAGTGSSNIAGNLPTVPFRDGAGTGTTRQAFTGYLTNTAIISPTAVYGIILATGSGTAFTVLDTGNNNIQSQNITNTTIMTLQGWYREA